MTNLLDERERAAENLFAHNEELLFLAHRAGVVDFAAWAADSMGLDEAASAAYAQTLIDAFIGGRRDDELVVAVQSDLERAGKGELSTAAAAMLAQKIASAADALAGRTAPRPLGRPADASHATHSLDATLSWRD